MICPACCSAEMIQAVRDRPYAYKGQSTVIAGVHGEFCPACDESVLGPDEAQRISQAMMSFNIQVNSNRLIALDVTDE
ncbi:MAG: type II toxin-antitoxin system MqsA family antitoxin [Pseudomonas piscis]|uniref:type II toxin-antitoxin system MqsA family antitoxin n=1 Tax=Pseudomonas piscis TaxID=2614538 RepID=UPI003D26889C